MNKALLKYEMERRGISASTMAEKLGISRSAFWRKCRGVSEFKLSEIERIIEVLELKDPSAVFFAGKVS